MTPTPAAAHLFVDDLVHPELSSADGHHLARALRLRPGEMVTASDGRGAWRCCRVAKEGSELAIEADGPIQRLPRPGPLVGVAFALTKGGRHDWVVQKLTEIGVDQLTPVVAARSIVRWDAQQANHHVLRLRRIAREAAMQSRRVWLPEVEPLVSFDALASRADLGQRATMAHPGGGRLSLDRPVIATGPEGGWDDRELQCGLPHLDLGATVLRAETSAVAAGVLLCALRSGLVAPAG